MFIKFISNFLTDAVYYILSVSHKSERVGISVLGRSPGEGNGSPLQYSCLGNLMNRGAWKATVHGNTKT